MTIEIPVWALAHAAGALSSLIALLAVGWLATRGKRRGR